MKESCCFPAALLRHAARRPQKLVVAEADGGARPQHLRGERGEREREIEREIRRETEREIERST